jgi:hypothetical protein
MEKSTFEKWARRIFLVATGVVIVLSLLQMRGKEAGAAEVRDPRTRECVYIVEPGDTLSLIAERYKATWQELWELNPQIVDPNLIYPGQRLTIPTMYKEPEPITKGELTERIAKFMFKKAMIPYDDEDVIEFRLNNQKYTLGRAGLNDLALQRQVAIAYITETRRWEIWQLTKAIVDKARTEEEMFFLIGLAWQESHFVNRRGSHREVSFFQFLPSTVGEEMGLDSLGQAVECSRLENDIPRAVDFAIHLLDRYSGERVWKYALPTYNRHPEYTGYVMNKVHRAKREIMR